uniref:Uncharacterized protein n=1 Tax=Avena sativa TaxID=4498 RepID=A0ACD5VFL4_AVESA
MDSVIIPRSTEIAAAEGALRWALVAFVSGQRASVSLIEAGVVVIAQVPRAEDNFTIHRSWPADFLLVYSSRRMRDDVVAAGVVDGRGFSLRFSSWNRQLQAVRQSLRYRAHIKLTGIPAYAWKRSTMVALLGSAAWVERLGATKTSREDLGSFRVVAWLDNVSRLPQEKALLIEEPDDLMEEDEGLVVLSDALIPLEKHMLCYVVWIRLVRAESMADDGHDPCPEDDGEDDGSDEDHVDNRGDGHGRGGGSRGNGDRRDGGSGRIAGVRMDGSLRRRTSGDGWSGSRRVAINSPLEVMPWLEVEGEDEEDDEVVDSDVEEGARVEERLSGESGANQFLAPVVEPPFDKKSRSGDSFFGQGPLFDQETIRDGCDHPVLRVEGPATYLPQPHTGELPGGPFEIAAHDGLASSLTCRAHARDAMVWPSGGWRSAPILERSSGSATGGNGAPGDQEGFQMASPGLLSSSDDMASSVWSFFDQMSSPRLVVDVMDVFSVDLSPADSDPAPQQRPKVPVAVATPVGRVSLETFRGSCKKPINSVLSRPVAKRCRNKKQHSGTVRRSGRIRGRFAPGTPIRQQQRTLITRLGIAREGKVIGDDALDAYLDLFARPMRQQHIDVVLRLFGWMPDALPLCDDAPVECLV